MTNPSFRIIVVLLAVFAYGVVQGAQPVDPQLEQNKQVVLAFTAAMRDQNLDAAAALMADDYVQHNPNVTPGKAGFIQYFAEIFRSGQSRFGTSKNPPVLLIAEGDVVMMAFRAERPEPTNSSVMYDSFWFEAYRVRNGKLVEHWDGALKPEKRTAAK